MQNSDKKLRNRRIRLIIKSILFVFSLVTVICLWKWMFVSPFKSFALESPYTSASDESGNLYVIDRSNTRILKISEDGELLWKIDGSDKTFDSADNIACDSKGNIYVHDTKIAKGVRLASERVLKFSPEGKFIETIKKWSYEGHRNEDGDERMRAAVVGMCGTDSAVIYIHKGEAALHLVNSDDMAVKSFNFENADDIVLSATYDEESGTLWYTTYNGRLLQYVDGVNDKLLFNSDNVEGSIIRGVSYGDNTLYAADIGLRNIITIDVATGAKDVLEPEGDISEREITYFVNADNKVVSTTSYGVSVWTDGECDTYYDVQLSSKLKVLTAILWIAIFIFAITTVINVVGFIVFIIRRATKYMRIILAIIAGVIAMGILFLGSVYPKFQGQLQAEVYSRENLAATVTAEKLPKDSFLALSKPSDFMNDDYKAVKNAVESIFLADTEDAKDIYCSLYRVIDGTITLTYSLESTCVVYPYDWDYEGSDEQEILETKEGKTYVNRTSSGSFIFVLQPILDDEGNSIGLIEVGKDLAGFENDSKEMLLTLIINIIAMTTIVILFVIEMFYFVAGKTKKKEDEDEKGEEDSVVPAGILRFVVFLICFFTNLTTAILPIYAMRIADKGMSFGLSPEFLAAIPISAEVVACALFSFIGNRIIKRIGAKKTALISSICVTLGLGLRVIPNIWVLALRQAILGAGWGTLVLMINILIAALPEDERDKGFAYYSAAGFSGANCGIIFGGFIIQWVSYSTMFFVTAVFSVALIFVTKTYLSKTVVDDEEEAEEETSNVPIRKLVLNPKILGFFIMMLVPAAVVGYYLNYMYPILGEEWGLTETYIGYSYLINALFVVAFGGLLTKAFSRRKRVGLALSSIVYALAFVVVVVFHSIPALFISLALVGISDGFGNPLMTGYFTDLEEVEEYGYDRAFGVYSIFENIAQSVGSFVFSYVLILGVGKGLSFLASVLIILSLIFMLLGIFDRRNRKVKQDVEEDISEA